MEGALKKSVEIKDEKIQALESRCVSDGCMISLLMFLKGNSVISTIIIYGQDSKKVNCYIPI